MPAAAGRCRQVWNLLPLDPVAWLVMWNEHQAAFARLVSESMCHRVPLGGPDDPPSPQVLSNLKYIIIS